MGRRRRNLPSLVDSTCCSTNWAAGPLAHRALEPDRAASSSRGHRLRGAWEARYRLINGTDPLPLRPDGLRLPSDASARSSGEMGLFADTEFVEGLPEGQRHFTPADLKSPGLLAAAQIILPRINRSPSVRQTV